MQDNLCITILLPCLNEEQTLKECIEEALQAIELANVPGEVLVADNGSKDRSVDIAVQAGARVVHEHQQGYGSALLAGINAARGKYILMGDADGSYDFKSLSSFLAKLEQGHDLVMGCRFPRCGGYLEPGAMPWKHRWIGNPGLSFLGRLFFKAPVDDFHCGLRAFRRDRILGLRLKATGMEFASEMVVKACLAQLKISQVPITLRRDKRNTPPHLRSWRDGWRHLRFMLLYAPNWLFIYPGILLTLFGVGGFMLLWPGPFKLGPAVLDLNTLLACSASALVGFQVLTIGTFAKAFAVSSGLLPPRKYIQLLIKGRSAEIGTATGFILVTAGVAVFGYSFLKWKAADFGPLPVQESLRLSIMALTLMGLGIQAAVTGFMLNLLGIKEEN